VESQDVPVTIAGRYERGEEVPGLVPGTLVLRARDTILDRDVLVALPEGDDAAAVLDAARRAALINEPELVKVVDVGEDANVSYIVTDAPAGEPLTRLVAAAPLAGGPARAVVGPLATAIDVARRRGVHHGDIRPDQVFVGPQGPQLFGLGFAGAVAGTPTDDPATADRHDTRGLVEVLYYAITGIEAGDPVVPASAVVPGVPADLETITTTALVEHTGPRHPQDLASALAPWRVEDLAEQTAAPGTASAPSTLAPTTGSVTRTSVRQTTSRDSAGASTPGTPPAAAPPRVHRWTGAAAAGAAVSGAAALPPSFPPPGAGVPVDVPRGVPAVPAPPAGGPGAVPPGPLPAALAQSPGGRPGAPGQARPTSQAVAADLRDVRRRAKRFRFNPTPVVLVLTVAGLGWAALWAFTSLTHGLGPIMTTSSQSPRATSPSDATSNGETGSSSPSTQETPEYDPPVIDSGKQLDPDGDDNEHPEMVDRAFDGDLQTYWMTRTYQSADFGGIDKRGIGLALTLEKATLVSKIYLTTGSTGGKVQIRDTTADDPAGGTVVATGSFDEDFTLTLDKPVVTDHLVIWITQLPKDADGKYVVRLSEVSLS